MMRFLLAILYAFSMSSSWAAEVIAHRGASRDYPENTLVAATQAWKEKADAVECDISLTRDQRVVVMHDEDTKRTTGVSGLLAEMDLAEIQKLDAGLWKGPPFAGTRVPSLDELLATGPAHRRFFVEIKCGPEIIPALKTCLQQSGLSPGQVVIISFKLPVLQAIRRELPDHPTLWVLSPPKKESDPAIDQIITEARAAGLTGLDLSYRWPVDRPLVEKVHAAGLQLHVWTVDDLAVAHSLAASGVDGITTNRPGFIRKGFADP